MLTKPARITKSDNLYFPLRKLTESPQMITANVSITISIDG